MLDKLGDHLSISLRLKEMPPLSEEDPDILVVGDDPIVDHHKLVGLV